MSKSDKKLGIKSHKELIADERMFDEFHPEGRYYAKRKYKADRWEKQDTIKEGQEVGFGSYCIIQIVHRHWTKSGSESGVQGYLLARVVDIETNEDWWSNRDNVIVKIIDASKPDLLEEYINRFKAYTVANNSYFRSGSHIVEFGRGNWSKYQVNQNG